MGTLAKGMALLAGGRSLRASWAIAGSGRGSLRLVFYTDVHTRTEWEVPVAITRAAEAINSKKADLVIAGGDLITDGFKSSARDVAPRWEAYMTMHQAIKGDLYPAIGNHDLVGAMPWDGTPAAKDPRAIFRSRMGLDSTYYSFNAVGYHFVMLDPMNITGNGYGFEGMILPEQLEWLKEDLSRVRIGTPIVVTTHIPLLSAFFQATRGATFTPPKTRVIVNNLEVLRIMKNHNVILVLQGHLHAREWIKWQDTTFIVGGAICGKWWRGPWHGTEEGFNVITLTRNRVDLEYIDYGWEAHRPNNR